MTEEITGKANEGELVEPISKPRHNMEEVVGKEENCEWHLSETIRQLKILLVRRQFRGCHDIIDTIEKKEQDKAHYRHTTVAEIPGVSTRIKNYLGRLGYMYIQDLAEAELEDIPTSQGIHRSKIEEAWQQAKDLNTMRTENGSIQ